MNGVLHIGLDDAQIEHLARDEGAGKASSTTLAMHLAMHHTAGTTVSATLLACMLAAQPDHHSDRSERTERSEHGQPIRVFATGGIGGVHRGWRERPDISADLQALAQTPVCVVCSGAKSILDIAATAEALETLGVPVIGHRTETFPRFLSPGDSAVGVNAACAEAAQIAEVCRHTWDTLGLDRAVLAVQPVPSDAALDAAEVHAASQAAETLAEQQGITGPARTPFLLQELVRATGGRSLRANLRLLLANAHVAAEIAVALAHP